MSAKIYSQKQCGSCIATKRAFDKSGLEYELVDITNDDETREYLRGLGYQEMPVVETENEFWTGYRPDKIKALAQSE